MRWWLEPNPVRQHVGALVVSVREKGRSIADIAGNVISARVRVMFLSFVAVVSWLVLAVFAMAIAGLFVATPSSVLPVNVEIIAALIIVALAPRSVSSADAAPISARLSTPAVSASAT